MRITYQKRNNDVDFHMNASTNSSAVMTVASESHGFLIWSRVGMSLSAVLGLDPPGFLLTAAWNEERPTNSGL
jgi:hypothetical protein